jgi:hypothetical protein
VSLDRPETIEEALAKLGTTEAEIADTLFNGGWKGKRSVARCCPVARYLSAMGFVECDVDTKEIINGDGDEVTTPDAVAMFICAFDGGEYPGLVGP